MASAAAYQERLVACKEHPGRYHELSGVFDPPIETTPAGFLISTRSARPVMPNRSDEIDPLHRAKAYSRLTDISRLDIFSLSAGEDAVIAWSSP